MCLGSAWAWTYIAEGRDIYLSRLRNSPSFNSATSQKIFDDYYFFSLDL